MAKRKGGFPHSEICGSKGARASPHLIAACHVLHSLSMPRHPSEALSRLIILTQTGARARRPIPRRRTRCARLGFDVSGIIHPCPRRLVRRCLHSRSALEALETPGKPFLHNVTSSPPRPTTPEVLRTCSLIDHERVSRIGNASPRMGRGARRVRTDDLMLAKHALYQLSYGPHRQTRMGTIAAENCRSAAILVGVRRLGHARPRMGPGGPRRTRTADLTLIRRVL